MIEKIRAVHLTNIFLNNYITQLIKKLAIFIINFINQTRVF
jgi:putative flippase GtrA